MQTASADSFSIHETKPRFSTARIPLTVHDKIRINESINRTPLLWQGRMPDSQGNSTCSPGLKKHQNIEEFLTTNEPSVRAYQGAEGRNKARCFMHPLCALFASVVSLS
jgi:hypothetical protein